MWHPLLAIVLAGLLSPICLLARAAEPTAAPLPRLETGMHTAPIKRIATDRAGRWAVTASDDKTARVWAVATGELVSVLRPPQDTGNEGKLYAVALSPDGETVAVGGWTQFNQGKTETAPDGHTIYLFERASGRLLRRIGGLPNVVLHLAWSPDGRWLAASLGAGGLRLFDAARGAETGRDADYGDQSYSVHFSPDGGRLVTTSYDGQVRLYAVEDGRPRLLQAARSTGGQRPYAARFSPDGHRVAVGFSDSTAVGVLDGQTLAELARPDTGGVGNGDLNKIAWSADGRHLLAGGHWDVDGKYPLRRWRVTDWGRVSDLPLSDDTLMDLAPLPGGGLLFAAADPAWGVLDRDGQVLRRQDGALADLRGKGDELRLSADGRRVRFGYEHGGRDARVFDLAARALGGDDPALAVARTEAPDLKIKHWQDQTDPSLDGRPLVLEPYETARALAIASDGRHFVLGADWTLRLYDRDGGEQWNRPVPGTAWAVNLSADGRHVVAGYGDGTIRWHRFGDGAEVLALFPHADRRRWIAWTPEGFYAASGPDAEELMGYHLNRGRDQAREFVSARQLREHYYQPGLISRRLDADGDRLMAKAVAKLGKVEQLLAGARAAPPQLELLSEASVASDGEVHVRVRVRDAGGGIGRLIYRIDGVELEGRPVGVVGDDTDSRVFTLPQGRREITVAATNGQGVESVPVRVVAEISPIRRAAPALHVLAVGVSAYRDPALRAGVRYAAKDAESLGRLFRERGKRLYREVNARVLVDGQATGEAIRAELEGMATKIAPQDVFVLYLAGHGTSFEREYHFIPWDAVYTSSEALRRRSLTHAQFRDLLKKVPATKTLILLDTCSAGGFGREEGRAIGDKDAIDRLSRLTGRAMIAATADGRMAIEWRGGHGAFTHALLEGLGGKADRSGNKAVEVRELADFVEDELPRITREQGFEQFPFSAIEGSSFTLLPKP